LPIYSMRLCGSCTKTLTRICMANNKFLPFYNPSLDIPIRP
jgi:hypothetical protein